ncbi:MAG: carbohydrate binding family 9 domain-containing protein [Bacteroidetes bacterium]|nr:carbohydrate binding family 9 domain-containing protein [Bacteroidota bacterium]
MKKILLCFFLLFFFINVHAQDSLKTYNATRITSSPKIDGMLDDEVWKNAQSVSDFIQNSPSEGGKVSQKTEIKILYDNVAIYVGAMLYDTAPDSILHELGNRDDEGLNADKFRFVIDPYNTRQDAYDFGVYASGVQTDWRFSDYTYNAVWQSAVKILSNGWSVEIKIPYSAIRFPSTKEQKWGLQLTRDIRRTREFDQWCLTPSGKANTQKYWGTLEGISNITPPLRLSLTPYISGYYQTSPEYNTDGTYNYSNSFSYNAGADIKYGLDERFTLDMTLLPDFGQVKSDDKVKNLSYREVNYEDNRPFFKEGVDLFNKDQLFYSRRIGKTPSLFYSVPNLIDSTESIEKNPSQAKLLNATKISGRGNGGMGFGLFNAVTDNTYAEIKNAEGKTRKILTEPFTNYNAFVFDQQLKNSSSVYFVNTNVMRDGNSYRDANVSGTGFSFQDKNNTFSFDGATNLSQIFRRNDTITDNFTDQMGYFYSAGIRKISGTWQYGIYHETMSKTFDRTDMGYYAVTNYSSFNANLSYNIFKPWKSLLRSFNNLNLNYGYNYTTKLPTDLSFNMNLFALFKSYAGIFCGGGFFPNAVYDYYEPRVEGRFSHNLEGYYEYAGFNTNYNKPFALDFNINSGGFMKNNIYNLPSPPSIGGQIKPRLRINDKLSFQYAFNFNYDPNNLGYANLDTNGDIIYGERILHTYINTLTARYIFKNDLSFSLNARHYWNTGEYIRYYTLKDDGMIERNYSYSGNNNFSYNAFTIDAVFSWQFAPGSLISIVYKNAIEKDEVIIPKNYSDNFSNTMQSPQTNSISLKVLYYLDYQQLKKRRS